jgi:GTP-binding protein
LQTTPVTFAGSAASPEDFPGDGLPEVALLGRSNVGKSSLLNALAGVKNLARVSKTPGRTRMVNFFRVGSEFYLVDLPGYGYARVPEAMRRGWKRLVTSYLEGRPALAAGVFLVDARHDPTEDDRLLQGYLDHQRIPYVLAATKADTLARGEAIRRRDSLRAGLGRRAVDVLLVSARTRDGVPALLRTIRTAAKVRREVTADGR